MTLREMDFDTARAIRATVLGLPGGRIDAMIAAENPRVTHAIPTIR